MTTNRPSLLWIFPHIRILALTDSIKSTAQTESLDLPQQKPYISLKPQTMRLKIFFAILAFTMSAAAQANKPVPSECVRVTASSAALRGRPSPGGKVVDMVSKGVQLESIAKRDAWVLVQTEDYAGWVEGKWIEPCNAAISSSIPVLPSAPPANTSPSSSSSGSSDPSGDGRTYTRGPRGGCYYLSPSGKKVYVDHSMCN